MRTTRRANNAYITHRQIGDGQMTKVVVPAGIVPFLCRGLRAEFGHAADRIGKYMLDFDDSMDDYEPSLKIFDAARRLREKLETTLDEPQDVELDLGDGAPVVIKSLESQFAAELIRQEERELYGHANEVSFENVIALGDFILDLREASDEGGWKGPPLPKLPPLRKRRRRSRKHPRR